MNRKLLFAAFLLALTLTFIAVHHQLTNAASNMAPPPRQAPPLEEYAAHLATEVVAGEPTWQVVAGGGGKDVLLWDVSMASPNEGWAVGGTGPSSYGVMMHYTNTTWSRVSVPTDTFTVNAVTMISPTEGWAAGYMACSYGECNRGQLMHYTAATGWQTVTVPAKPGAGVWGGFYGIDITGTTGWIVGDNYGPPGSPSFLQFDGTNWTPVSAPGLYFNGVSMVNANDAWAVATDYFFNSSGTAYLAHYSGGSWSEVTSTVSATGPVYMKGIHMLSASDGWAVGYAGSTSSGYQCVLLHYNGSNWSQVSCPAEASDVQLASVYMRSSNDVWAVGNQYTLSPPGPGVILYYDGSAWTRATAPPGTLALRSIKLVGSDDGWAVGARGTILRLVGGNWTRVQGPSLFVGPVDSVNANEAWYGGANGEWLQWKNGVSISHTNGMTLPIAALDMLSPTVGWGGTNLRSSGYIAKFADGSWTITPTYSTRVYGISILGPEEGWFATSGGLIHYSSGAWQTHSNIYNGAYSVSMLDADHGWAVSRWKRGLYTTGVYTYANGVWTTPLASIPTLRGTYGEIKVIGISPDEAWIAGWSLACSTVGCPVTPRLLHFSNNAWQTITMTNWLAFYDISRVSATEWWAAGKLTTMEYAFLHYKDGTYTVVPAAGEDVVGVSMLPDGSGFARGVGSLLKLVFPVTATVEPSTPTTLIYTGTAGVTTTVSVPAGAVTSTTTLVYTPLYIASAPHGFSFAGHTFDLSAYQGNTLLPDFVFSTPVTITIHYTDADVAGLDENTLALRYWTGSTWASDGISVIERNPAKNYVVFTITHLSQFALFAMESHKVYLPAVIRQ